MKRPPFIEMQPDEAEAAAKGPRFVQTLSYRVGGDLQEGAHAAWLGKAAELLEGLEGLEDWRVLRERTGERGFTHQFVYRNRAAFRATQQRDDLKARFDALLQGLGPVVDPDSVEIRFWDPVPVGRPTGG